LLAPATESGQGHLIDVERHVTQGLKIKLNLSAIPAIIPIHATLAETG
jgi:hypothetical protein